MIGAFGVSDYSQHIFPINQVCSRSELRIKFPNHLVGKAWKFYGDLACRQTFSPALRSSRVSATPWADRPKKTYVLMAQEGMIFSCSIPLFYYVLIGIQICPGFSGTPLLCLYLHHVPLAMAGFSSRTYPDLPVKNPHLPRHLLRSELSESISALSGGIVSRNDRMGLTGTYGAS